jgi:hypothetical protein
MVAIWVSEPIGVDKPRRTRSTPAMKVVATAPRPGVKMASLPVAGAMFAGVPRVESDTAFILQER